MERIDYFDGAIIVNKGAICNSPITTIEKKVKEIEEEYENKLQRQKVHISGGDRITGRRIYGRRYKVTISKGLFRNKKGIVSCPTKS